MTQWPVWLKGEDNLLEGLFWLAVALIWVVSSLVKAWRQQQLGQAEANEPSEETPPVILERMPPTALPKASTSRPMPPGRLRPKAPAAPAPRQVAVTSPGGRRPATSTPKPVPTIHAAGPLVAPCPRCVPRLDRTQLRQGIIWQAILERPTWPHTPWRRIGGGLH